MRKRNPLLGLILALASALLFGLNASTSKVVMATGITPEQIVIFRSLATAGIAGIALLLTNPSRFRVARGEWKVLIGFGIVGVALMQWAYSNAVANLPVAIALLIEYTAIVIVPVASIVLFKERVRKRLWLGVALVLVGLAIVSQLWQGGLNPVGLIFAALAAVFLSVYFIMGEHTQRKRDTLSTLFYTMLIAAVFWLIISPWYRIDASSIAAEQSLTGALSGVSVPLWLLLAWLGVFGAFVPMWFSYLALGNLSATAVGIASAAETVFAFIFGYLWLQEEITGLQALGGLLVIAGIVLAQTARITGGKATNEKRGEPVGDS